jgi:hypothetical protein
MLHISYYQSHNQQISQIIFQYYAGASDGTGSLACVNGVCNCVCPTNPTNPSNPGNPSTQIVSPSASPADYYASYYAAK